MSKTILVRPSGKRNALTLIVGASIALVLSVSLLSLWYQALFFVGIFLVALSLMGMLLGVLKWREPEHSLVLTPQALGYCHRRGKLLLNWANIQRIDVPRVHGGLGHQPLNLLGIRLKDVEPVLAVMPPRLASHLLMEQRALLLQNPQQGCRSGQCYSESLLEEDRYVGASGQRYTGLIAMLGHRMERLSQQLGYHLYIHESELDRSVDQMVRLLRQCQQSALASEPES